MSARPDLDRVSVAAGLHGPDSRTATSAFAGAHKPKDDPEARPGEHNEAAGGAPAGAPVLLPPDANRYREITARPMRPGPDLTPEPGRG